MTKDINLLFPAFLRRKPKGTGTAALAPAPVEQSENTVAPAIATATDMVILSMYLNEGGHRRFLWVSEGNRIAHLLHVPTLEYVQVPVVEIARQKATGRATEEPVEAGMATIIRAKTQQWDRLQKRFSRILVNEALAKLGAAPLPTIIYADDSLPRAEDALSGNGNGNGNGKTEAKPRGRKPSGEKGKKDAIADLLLRKEGCTTADVLALTGWPAVSMPAQAKLVGLTLRKEKHGKTTRYWGAKA